MARFTRRYPQLLDPLLKQMLGMVAVRPTLLHWHRITHGR